MKNCPLESVEQQHLVAWADATPLELPFERLNSAGDRSRCEHIGDLLFAIPNGGSRRKLTGRVSLEALRMRREGVRAGVPDLMLAIPSGSWHGLYIEMKRRERSASRVSPDQKDWLERLRRRGYRAEVCYGAKEAIALIREYLGLSLMSSE